MKVDNSSLTGESEPMQRTPECSCPENPLETKNLAFFGTSCCEGIGRGVVINIGDNTVIGQIANLAAGATSAMTPLRAEINRFIGIVSKISFAIGIVFFFLGFVVGYPFVTNVLFGIGIIVANVPEGLIAIVTLSLTITARKLATKKVLVKNLEAVETLGSTTCICSDKTGTLTQNKMTVRNLWYDGSIKKGENYQKFGARHTFDYNIDTQGFKELQEVAVLCSDATFNDAPPQELLHKLNEIHNGEEKRAYKLKVEKAYAEMLRNKFWLDRPTVGDASESALIRFFQPVQEINEIRNRYPLATLSDGSQAKLPFNSTNKFMLKIYENPKEESNSFFRVCMKVMDT
jgi:sodium/potassium-transporting ATPase subunit alpha